MASGIQEPHPVRPVRKRRRRRILIWLSLDLTVAIVLIGLLLHRPAAYKPMVSDADANDPQHVDRYLTSLSAELYNGAQTRRPFDLLVLEEGINRAIGSERWSDPLQDAAVSAFSVTFSPEGIVAMGTASLKGASFVVTIGIEPKIDPQGLLALHVTQVKVGALSLTPLARMMAKRMYAQRLATVPVDTEDIRTRIAAALLDDKALKPVLLVRNRWVRLESLQLQKGQILLRFGPSSGG
jgi:uncharacterized protein YpmS